MPENNPRTERNQKVEKKMMEQGKQKVLIVEYFLPESIYTLELARELRKDCDLTVFCRTDAGVTGEGIRWIPEFYPGGKKRARAMWEYAGSLLKLAAVIRKGRFDVIHIQAFKSVGYELALYRGLRKCYRKLVLTVHNILPHEAAEREKEKYRQAYEFCDELIVHNETSARCLSDQFGIERSRITVIPHGAYQSHMHPGKGKKKDGRTHFLQFGLVREYKGIDILLEAVARIPEEDRKKLRFTVAGKQYSHQNGTDYRELIRSLGIEDCVSFQEGYVPDGKLDELFGEADFLVFPYRHIYGSGALLLAYTYKKPVIVSNIPAFVEETDKGGTGILFESENPDALAGALLEAAGCGEERLRQYRAEIRRLVAEKYNWKKSAARTAEIYRR